MGEIGEGGGDRRRWERWEKVGLRIRLLEVQLPYMDIILDSLIPRPLTTVVSLRP